MTYVYDIDVDTICFLFVCADVAPRRHEVELLRVSACQEPERPLRGGPRVGERCQHEDANVRPANPERVARRCRLDNPSVGPSHAPLADAEADFEDIRCHLEVVL
jgi:hypothetical protein